MTVSPWITAARPRTLILSLTPVIVGASLAWAVQAAVSGLAIFAALVGAMCIQLGTNLHNDAQDSERGGDGPDRIGPLRVTASGLLTAASVKRGAALCYVAAALLGLYLVLVGGWPILLLGILSIAAGWAYTGGPLPIAYTPLGEVFVVAFFGVGAVCGTYWLATTSVNPAAIVAGLALGFFAGAVLLVNNYRDAEADERVGRRTLAIMVGPRISVWIYALLVLIPFALLPLIANAVPRGHVWPALIALPLALLLIYRFMNEARGRGFNSILVLTVQMQFLFGAMLGLGLLLG
jgi:1,4-dihydroxy-2-naphthoate octaprenyltransferase